MGALLAMVNANFSTAGINSLDGNTLFINPISRASLDEIFFPLSNISIALPFPISLGKRCVPPNPAINPKLTSG